MKNQDLIFEFAYIVFNACISKWGITDNVMAKIIEKYQLVQFLDDNVEYLNERGLAGIVIEVEKYLQEEGEPIEKFV